MRVIAGSARGHKLKSVPGTGTRPITDRVKKALFDILGPSIQDARFLDLFAGTGSVGIEALSRGASHATFVERHGRAVSTIKGNLTTTRLIDKSEVIQDDVFRFLFGRMGEPYDAIYVAPPQYRGLWATTLRTLDSTSHMAPHSVVIAQMFPKEHTPLDLAVLRLIDQRRYGSTLLCFYQPAATQGSGEP